MSDKKNDEPGRVDAQSSPAWESPDAEITKVGGRPDRAWHDEDRSEGIDRLLGEMRQHILLCTVIGILLMATALGVAMEHYFPGMH